MRRATALGAIFMLLGCDGDSTPPSHFDSGADVTTDATGDASDGGTDAASARAKIIAVHASPDIGPFRLCIATGLQNDGSDAKIAPISPIPKTGIAAGAGAALPDLGTDFSKTAITPYIFLTQKIGSNAATCDVLATSFAAGSDYFILPTIKNGTLAPNTTVMLALTGCVRTAIDSTADLTTCGATYDAVKGNLALDVLALDRVVGNTQRFGSQLLHVASPASGVWAALYGTQSVNAALHPLDGGADEIMATTIMLGQLAPSSAASLAMPTIDQTALQVTAAPIDGGAPPASLTIPLPLVYEATTGLSTGENAYFAPGVNYTFVFLGDPRAPTTLDGGVFNGYSLHALAFPNDPPLP